MFTNSSTHNIAQSFVFVLYSSILFCGIRSLYVISHKTIQSWPSPLLFHLSPLFNAQRSAPGHSEGHFLLPTFSCPPLSCQSINQFTNELYKSIIIYQSIKKRFISTVCMCAYQREMRLYALEQWPADLSRVRETAHSPAARGCFAAAPPPQSKEKNTQWQFCGILSSK